MILSPTTIGDVSRRRLYDGTEISGEGPCRRVWNRGLTRKVWSFKPTTFFVLPSLQSSLIWVATEFGDIFSCVDQISGRIRSCSDVKTPLPKK